MKSRQIGEAKKRRDSARRLAKQAISCLFVGNLTRAESLWELAKDAAIHAMINQTYQNGIKEGKRRKK